MKKTCKGCKAYTYYGISGMFDSTETCELGYKICDGVPQEECPKPKTNDKLIEVRR